MQFSKMEIIARQTNTAIEQLLMQGDEVSIRTLLSAALRVARDLASAKGTQRHYEFESLIDKNSKKSFNHSLTKAANFFKHADLDSSASLDDFDLHLNEYLIWWIIILYQDLGGELSNQMKAFTSWIIVQEEPVAPECISWLIPGKVAVSRVFKKCQELTQNEAFVFLILILQARIAKRRAV